MKNYSETTNKGYNAFNQINVSINEALGYDINEINKMLHELPLVKQGLKDKQVKFILTSSCIIVCMSDEIRIKLNTHINGHLDRCRMDGYCKSLDDLAKQIHLSQKQRVAIANRTKFRNYKVISLMYAPYQIFKNTLGEYERTKTVAQKKQAYPNK